MARTVDAFLVLAQAIRDKTNRVIKGPRGPSLNDAVIRAGMLKELLQSFGGIKASSFQCGARSIGATGINQARGSAAELGRTLGCEQDTPS